MARSDLLLRLVRAAAQGDQLGVKRTVEAIAAEERERQHHVFADRLTEIIAQPTATTLAPRAHNAGLLATPSEPRRLLTDVVLKSEQSDALLELVEEQNRADLLRSHGLEPRHRVLLAGPPGNGKTSVAEALAGELGLQLHVARHEALFGSALGETASRVAELFAIVRSRRCVLFFDEFDAIAKERGDEHEVGEIKRVVSALLLNIDALPSYVVVVVATNHPELLDRAAWRRFQIRLTLDRPTRGQIIEMLSHHERRLTVRLSGKKEVDLLVGCNFSDIEDVLIDVHRRHILAGPGSSLEKLWKARVAQVHRP